MEINMKLTPEQQAMLDGEHGETKAKVMKTLVMYGEAFDAKEMIPVTSEKGHLVTSFGLSVVKPVFKLMQTLIDAGAISEQKFTVDPYPLDKRVPTTFVQGLVQKIIYSQQKKYDKQLEQLGLDGEDKYTCTCYMDEVGNTPKKGEILSWAESSAVVYANSVLGARCNRNSGIFELFGSIAGCVPKFGLLTDEGRKATWVIEVKTTNVPEAQVLGSAIGMKVMEDVPYIKGLDKFIGKDLDNDTKAYLKDLGGAAASNGAVGLYHVENVTPEAVEQGDKLITENAQTYVIDDDELKRVKDSYPCIWKDPNAKPKLAFIGCPHLSLDQLKGWTDSLKEKLEKAKKDKLEISTVFTASPGVLKAFEKTEQAKVLDGMGGILSYTCPLMYMNNPTFSGMPVITNSNKLRTYSTARYYTDAEISELLVKGVE